MIGADDPAGGHANGWLLRHAHLPAKVAEAHSETAYMTDRALAYMEAQGDKPWVLHLSYIKPHWPLMAPAPYHAMYRCVDTGPILRADPRTENAHPVLQAYRLAHDDCRSYGQEDVVRHVRPTYMGLIKQVDDHLQRVTEYLDRSGRAKDTLIVFTADHGDHLGDHGTTLARHVGGGMRQHAGLARMVGVLFDVRGHLLHRSSRFFQRAGLLLSTCG